MKLSPVLSSILLAGQAWAVAVRLTWSAVTQQVSYLHQTCWQYLSSIPGLESLHKRTILRWIGNRQAPQPLRIEAAREDGWRGQSWRHASQESLDAWFWEPLGIR